MKVANIEFGKINYKDQGTSPVIVFLHGALSNGNTWRKVVNTISKDYRCIVPDLPLGGHLQSLDSQTDLTPTGFKNIIGAWLTISYSF